MSILKAIFVDQESTSVSEDLTDALRIYDQAVLDMQEAIDQQVRQIHSNPKLEGK